MTDQQYEHLLAQFKQVFENQVILSNKLNNLQSDIHVIINNTKIICNDQDKLIEDVQKIKRVINK